MLVDFWWVLPQVPPPTVDVSPLSQVHPGGCGFGGTRGTWMVYRWFYWKIPMKIPMEWMPPTRRIAREIHALAPTEGGGRGAADPRVGANVTQLGFAWQAQ